MISSISASTLKKQLNPIVWSTDNKLFKQQNNEEHKRIINVKIGDFLNILCPKYTNSAGDLEYNSIYMVNKNEYEQCELGSANRLLLKCDRPLDTLKFTLYISKFSPVPDAIEFTEGRDYYIISTSDGSLTGLNSTSKGTCQANNMKLIIRVSNADERSKTTKNIKQIGETTRTNQYIKRLTSNIMKTTTKLTTTTSTTTTTAKTMISITKTITTNTEPTTLKTVNDIFILEPIDNSNDYSDLLTQLITSNSNNNSENNMARNVLNEKQLASNAVLPLSKFMLLCLCLFVYIRLI